MKVCTYAWSVLLGASLVLASSSSQVWGIPRLPGQGNLATRTIAITFDDLPGAPAAENCERAAFVDLNRRLLAGLEQGAIPAVGFVVEGHGCASRADILPTVLGLWLDADLSLGNHTYSHLDLNATSVSDYQTAILDGERVLRPMLAARGEVPRYFRYPALHTGNTAEKKETIESYLDELGYRNAPVTIDSQEWVFASAYRQAIRRGQPDIAQCVADAYLPFMEAVVAFFEAWSVEIMGYEIPQVLLLHANELNARHFPELVTMLRERGYRFVSLDEALMDPAYQQPDDYVGPRGLSWLHRWALTRGIELREEPRDPPWVAEFSRSQSDVAIDWSCPIH